MPESKVFFVNIAFRKSQEPLGQMFNEEAFGGMEQPEDFFSGIPAPVLSLHEVPGQGVNGRQAGRGVAVSRNFTAVYAGKVNGIFAETVVEVLKIVVQLCEVRVAVEP